MRNVMKWQGMAMAGLCVMASACANTTSGSGTTGAVTDTTTGEDTGAAAGTDATSGGQDTTTGGGTDATTAGTTTTISQIQQDPSSTGCTNEAGFVDGAKGITLSQVVVVAPVQTSTSKTSGKTSDAVWVQTKGGGQWSGVELYASSPGPLTTLKVGDVVTVTAFTEGQLVDVIGVTTGKGFQGVVKRWRVAGGPCRLGEPLAPAMNRIFAGIRGQVINPPIQFELRAGNPVSHPADHGGGAIKPIVVLIERARCQHHIRKTSLAVRGLEVFDNRAISDDLGAHSAGVPEGNQLHLGALRRGAKIGLLDAFQGLGLAKYGQCENGHCGDGQPPAKDRHPLIHDEPSLPRIS